MNERDSPRITGKNPGEREWGYWRPVSAVMRYTLAALATHLALSCAFISIRRTQSDGWTKTEVQKQCTELAPGVNYCQELGDAGVDLLIDVMYKTPALPNSCRKSQKVKKDPPLSSQLLVHHVGSWAGADGVFQPFFKHDDFTVANATRLGADTLKAWDMAVDGLCEGERVVITLPPQLGFDEPGARLTRPQEVPVGATLRYDVEIIKVLHVAPDGTPYRPCFFSLIDADGSGDLDEIE